MRKNSYLPLIITAVIIFGAPMAYWAYYMTQPGKYDGFAECIKESGATFYGAFWCPHCQEQKAMFGKSVSLLPYVECSTADGKGRTEVCETAEVTQYPTWQFADGTRKTGTLPLATLAEATSCTLPE